LKDKMAAFKIPQELKVVESIPRNAMGKSKFLFWIKMVMSFANSLRVQSTRNSWSYRYLGLNSRDDTFLSTWITAPSMALYNGSLIEDGDETSISAYAHKKLI
jgi:hypothetical protein